MGKQGGIGNNNQQIKQKGKGKKIVQIGVTKWPWWKKVVLAVVVSAASIILGGRVVTGDWIWVWGNNNEVGTTKTITINPGASGAGLEAPKKEGPQPQQ
jgi:hypothetical protein